MQIKTHKIERHCKNFIMNRKNNRCRLCYENYFIQTLTTVRLMYLIVKVQFSITTRVTFASKTSFEALPNSLILQTLQKRKEKIK